MMQSFENSFISRKAAEAEARIAAEKKRKAQVWRQIQTEEPDLAMFIQETARIFGKPSDTQIDLRGKTVVAATGVFLKSNLKPVDDAVKDFDRFCSGCRHWKRDKKGDGTGIGDCSKGDKRLHWPAQTACKFFDKR